MSDTSFIPLAEPDLGGREAEYLARCVADGWVSSAGPFVTELERLTADACGTEHAVATANGTSALSLLLLAMGVGPSDHVIVPDWTFAATANAVVHIGAVPVFADVSNLSGAMDTETLGAALASCEAQGLAVKAAIVVHPLGIPADMDELVELCAARGVVLIEDAAGAIGSSYRGRPVGGIADGGIISFNGNKLVTAGGGGMVVTNDAALADKARHLSTQARVGARYRYDAAGYNYRLTNVCAAVGVAQMERIDDLIATRLAIAVRYEAALEGRVDLVAPHVAGDVVWNGWMFAVRTASTGAADALVEHLNAAGIGARHFWARLSDQAPYAAYPSHQGGGAKALSETLVSLPNSTTMTEEQVERVVVALESWRGAEVSL